MNVRPLSPPESKNLAVLNDAGVISSLVFVTATALNKSILDATAPVRTLLRETGTHDYDLQSQGPENKCLIEAVLLADEVAVTVRMSLYRPVTKDGDPRMWFTQLGSHCAPNDVLAIFVVKSNVHVVNLSRIQLHQNDGKSVAARFFADLRAQSSVVADELLDRLRQLANSGPLTAAVQADTAVGRSVETALGIAMNASRKPDYKGIELKSGRSKLMSRETRAALFTCVPDWTISACQSSAEILDRFGYARAEEFKLYCTVSSRKPNSQGLQLELQEVPRYLKEVCATHPRDVAVWNLAELETRLLEKHKETFWIKARAERSGGLELFHLLSVVHTRNPNLPQLERMLSDGTVTVDHLIKRTASGGAREKGPSFKIERKRIPELFLGAPQEYKLV
jgi:MvaI/BcnI restriction endonuclease family